MPAGLGTIEIKAMHDAGYDDDFSVGVTAASSTIGPIIPPQLPMVIYGVMATSPSAACSSAGWFPALLMAAALMVMVACFAHEAELSAATPAFPSGGPWGRPSCAAFCR